MIELRAESNKAKKGGAVNSDFPEQADAFYRKGIEHPLVFFRISVPLGKT